MYRFALLSPLRVAGAAARNEAVFAASCLGIEVTEPELAGRCRLGNIDPQHSGGRSDLSAIACALHWPLPSEGATLVTIRPDADAFGAMAVLRLRAEGVALSHDMLRRISLIDEADRFAHGAWPGPRPLPATLDDVDEVGLGPEGLGAVVVHAAAPAIPLEMKIDALCQWLLSGAVPADSIATAASAAMILFDALQAGSVTVRDVSPNTLAHVRGFAPGALRLGYRRAPVVIAECLPDTFCDTNGARRIAIAQYCERYIDLAAATRRLNDIENGWGGSPTIIGSPQGVYCTAPLGVITEIVLDSLLITPPNSANRSSVGQR